MSKLLFSPTLKRWLFNIEVENNNEYTQSKAFTEGYDDPTYMTFKIEFGDWGASVLDRSQINNGTTSFIASKNDYDALPIGLLNCPYDGASDEKSFYQTGANSDSAIFNDTTKYSAFTYLRSRNEDTRAKYLYYFVNGLYEIQKDCPYMFKKISGLDTLEAFDPKVGQRLKEPAKITLDCFEGLNLKIRTLLEFYRKAAWDDVYQRWILPENMRQFKMIIYVFERRTFHEFSANKKNVISQYADFNADLPVKAYECCPCEFDIAGSQSWKSDYANDYSNNEEDSKIVISVKNVKTYFKNGLLSTALGLEYETGQGNSYTTNIMIYDLVESIERSSSAQGAINSELNSTSTIENATLNGVRSLFLNKNILLENDDALETISAYIWGKSTGGALNKYAQNNETQISNIKSITSNMLNIGKLSDSDRISADLMKVSKTGSIKDDINRGGWMSVLVNSPSYDPNCSFWENLAWNLDNLLVGGRRQVLVSGGNFNLVSTTWSNSLQYLFYSYPYISVACDRKIIEPMHTLVTANKGKRAIEDVSFGERTIPDQVLEEILPERTLQPQTYDSMLPERTVPTQQFDEMLPERIIDEQKYTEMLPERQIPIQKFKDQGDPREVPDQNMVEQDKLRTLPDQELNGLFGLRDIPSQELNDLGDLRDIPEQDMSNLDKLRDIPSQTFSQIDPERDIPDQNLNKLIDERIIPDQTLNLLDDPRALADQELNTLGKVRETNSSILQQTLEDIRKLPGFDYVTLEDIRTLPEQELKQLEDKAKKAQPDYILDKLATLDVLSKATEKRKDIDLVALDKDNIQIENAIISNLRENMKMITLKDENDLDDKGKKQLDIANFAKVFCENENSIKDAFVDNIANKRNQLIQLSNDTIRQLPEIDMYKLDKQNNNSSVAQTLVSLSDVEQIDKNIPLLSLKDEDLRQLSFQTLINIQKELDERIKATEPLVGLTKTIEESHNKKKDKEKLVAMSGQSKSNSAQKMVTLLPPREANRQIVL